MVLDKETIGVTGGSGLLGQHVIYFFLKKNFKIIALSRKNPKLNIKILIGFKSIFQISYRIKN